MDFQQLLDAITTVGFPIAVSCFLLYKNSQDMKSVTQALENNTIVLEKILTKLGEE